MKHDAIDTHELARWIEDRRDGVLLDVLPDDAHAELRIPGSRNACVYLMDFESRAAEVAPDRGAPVVVYGSGGGSLDVDEAAERLVRAGWTNVRRYAGGRAAWQEAGQPLEGDRAGEPWRPWRLRSIAPGEYAIDVEQSAIDWTGRNVSGSHFGSMRLLDGRVEFDARGPAGGVFTIDMRSIEVHDLPTEALRNQLKAHLESSDFFAVEAHPTARLTIVAATPRDGVPPGQPNFDVRAELELRGRTEPVAFAATVSPHREADVALEAHFDIDRTRWGVNYGSGRLFHRLGMHLVHDAISLQVRVVAR